ncbi:MAG TPA: helix-turn-helix domain-containing protein [Hyphomicrobium sp.]|nr:helix-turn-helix domain-containing protein [Hyphomicrobium sp.]HEX2842960.1 helix-turn-helix domain-containing protein [Hyphomicrobium sp.]
MNERAASLSRNEELLPIWHLDPRRALFVGPLTYNAPHAHSVPVYLAGLYERFRLRIEGRAWQHCRTAVIPAGVSYEFDVAGQPLAVLYLEPCEAGFDALVPLMGTCRADGRALLGSSGELSILRALYETRDSARWTDAALDSLLGFSSSRARRAMDPRVSHVVAALARNDRDTSSAAVAARDVGLSSSRFQHLFAQDVGVPFRRFRVWQRLRSAIGEIVAGSSFTDAAHAAGFADQAHFSRAFRRTFGAPASPSLRHVRRA